MENERPLTPEEVSRIQPEPATARPPAVDHVIASAVLASDVGDETAVAGSRLRLIGSARRARAWQIDLTTNLRERADV
jgi:hypothetical protein